MMGRVVPRRRTDAIVTRPWAHLQSRLVGYPARLEDSATTAAIQPVRHSSSSSTGTGTGLFVSPVENTRRPATAAAIRATVASTNAAEYPKRFATKPATNELMPTNRSTNAPNTLTAEPRSVLGIFRRSVAAMEDHGKEKPNPR